MGEESCDGTACVCVCVCVCVWSQEPQECGLQKYKATISFLIQLLGMVMQCLGVSAPKTTGGILIVAPLSLSSERVLPF